MSRPTHTTTKRGPWALVFSLFTVSAVGPALGAPPQTVAVVPPAGEEGSPAWVGEAFADATTDALVLARGMGVYSARQLLAAARQVGLEGLGDLDGDALDAVRGQLGGPSLVTGSYAVEDDVVAVDVGWKDANGRRHTVSLRGALAELDALALDLAGQIVASIPGASLDPLPQARRIDPAGRATVTRALRTLRRQSLAPRYANPAIWSVLEDRVVDRLEGELRATEERTATYGPVHQALALLAAVSNREDEARRELEEARADSWHGIVERPLLSAFIERRFGRPDLAERILREATRTQPASLHVRGTLAEYILHGGRIREARAAFRELLESSPDQPWVWAQLGYCEARLGRHDEAIEATREAVAIMPGSSYLRAELAGRYIDAGRLREARSVLEEVLARWPDDVRARVRLGYIALLERDDAAAMAITQEALDRMGLGGHPRERAYAHLNLARLYGRRVQIDEALWHLKKALEAADVPVAELEEDPALGALRADVRYRELVGG